MSFSITLHDFPDADPQHRRAAETRYRSVLEEAFGSTAAIVTAVKAWQAVTTASDDAQVTSDERALALRFFQVSVQARKAVLRRASDPSHAYFEVTLH
ncbi:hypothetical protein [uncultured Xylophilus sp.]|uniref:hypothetical protein n=1 Tax=uncultured Xylophilus sp. TaxID=296832 RepID=UPI0025F1830B|nr:hypothetical protein [uncultured Xylophilus sp.]